MSNQSRTAGEITREAIIDASFQLFTEKGYHGTSMRDIATRAGITAGSIYNHFTDKEQIIQKVLLKYHPIMRVLPRLAEAEGASAEVLVRDAACRIAEEVEATPGVLKLVFVELIDLGGKHVPDLALEMWPRITQFVEKVYSSDEIARPGDPVTFFSAFAGMLMGYAFTHGFFEDLPGQPAGNRSLDTYVEIFLRGILNHTEYVQA